MKTLIKIILFSFLLSSVSTYSQSGICDNFGKEKALYVGGFFEGYNNNPLKETQSNYHEQILGNKHKEQALIDYAIRNKISHLYLYGLDKLFINGKGSENYLGFYGLLKDFIVECNSPSLDPSKKIKVSFAFSPGITENYHRHSLVTPTKDRVIENFEADTFFSTWPLIKGLITEGTETDFSINTMLYIYGSVKHLNRLFEKSTSEFAQLGVHAITVEHEWWHAKDLAPEDMAVYIKARLDTHLTYLSILAEMREEEVIQEVHEYLGEISDNISTTNRNIILNTLSSAVSSKQNFVLDKVNLVLHGTLISTYVNSSAFRNYLASLNNPNVNPHKGLKIAPLFYAAHRFVFSHYNGDGDPVNVDSGIGNELSDGLNGVDVFQAQYLVKEDLEDFVNPANALSNQLVHTGFTWYEYRYMPNMLYTTDGQNKNFEAKELKLLVPLNRNISEGGRYHTLNVFNSDREDFNSNGSEASANGNTYIWFRTDNNMLNLANIANGGNKLVLDRNVNPTGTYFVQTTHASSNCITTSPPRIVDFIHHELMIPDNENDTGLEPNFTYDEMWVSPEIWVNQIADIGAPGYLLPGDFKRNETNYIHVRVYNKGNTTTNGTEQLHLYYHKATTTARWPESWFLDRESGFFIGKRINQSQIILDPITPNSSNIVDYAFTFSKNDVYGSGHYCVLARITKSDIPDNFGMNYQETENIYDNIRNNRTVASRNFTILELKAPNPGPTNTPVGWDVAELGISNPLSNSINSRLYFNQLRVSDKSLQTDGAIKINLGKELYAKWIEGGRQGFGVSKSSFNLENRNLEVTGAVNNTIDSTITTIDLLDSAAWIGGIALDSGFKSSILVGFKLHYETQESGLYDFDIRQSNEFTIGDTLMGGEHYSLKFLSCLKPTISRLTMLGKSELIANSTEMQAMINFQWFKDGTQIVGASSPNYQVQSPGFYQVRVSYVNGCQRISDGTQVNSNVMALNPSDLKGDLSEVEELKIRKKVLLFPNPTAEYFYLFTGELPYTVIKIYGLDGQELMFIKKSECQVEPCNISIDMLKPGLYWLTLENESILKRLMFEKLK